MRAIQRRGDSTAATSLPATRCSIIVTSCRGFEAWGEILGDALVAALIGRLVHDATMVTLKGKTYRLRERAAVTSDKPRQRARPQALSGITD